ncbi:hypothetical protein RHODO2019_10755 [Rhodococcus antarcticus]|uniref:SPOR domain-containing protein n=1 Tax=Rhodococcus antarcticus TaxID=2987751 RepID=A0ABY6NWC1_9NOCA|nr:hypothetical protein [Rhodococcus antarcticus]UZJ23687.1 hypothetical protein RHODO2019_10755 [Rhodococcus antarcticus]
MKLTPRADEVKAVVALLESDGYDSATALAKDIIRTVGEQLSEREMYAWVWRAQEGSYQLAWGPFSSEFEVRSMAKKAGLGGDHMTLKLYSVGAMTERLDAKAPSPMCATCGHPHGAHEHPKQGGKCSIKKCTCKRDTKV